MTTATPAMAQWFAVKDAHPDALVFFRMGDFYELFFADAEAAASALGIALTARGQHDGQPIPMCGVPLHAADGYLGRLIRRGHRVAVVEQTEPGPSEGGRKPGRTPLRREVVRLVTAGTLTEDSLLQPGRPSLLVAIAAEPGGAARGLALANADLAAGTIETERVAPNGLAAVLARLDPAEILAPEGMALGGWERRRGPARLAASADASRGRAAACWGAHALDAFGSFSDGEAIALALLLDYARAAGAGKLPLLAPPLPRSPGGFLAIDAATRSSLAIGHGDEAEGATLFGAVNRTRTAAGARLLASRLAAPLDDAGAIRARQAEWVALRDAPAVATAVGSALRGSPDAARALGRLSLNRGGPRDLASIRDAIGAAHAAVAALDALPDIAPFRETRAALRAGDTLRARLTRTLAADLPARSDDGGYVAEGVDAALDAARLLARDARGAVAALGTTLAVRYAVPGLKIRHHAQLGFVIEVNGAAAEGLRARPELVLRQGMAGGARFGSAELAALDERIGTAAATARAREAAIFADMVEAALADTALPALLAALASLDCAVASASLAGGGDWCVPTVTDDDAFALEACRHPVVEAALPPGERFVPNDCVLGPERRLALITGPNMAGKSTFLRQTALAVVLAQAGLPVPARSARIGLVDRLFSRVGAADDLARGRSTFMVEMIETAAILHAAGPRSLVVVDEIGRGTSTLDGLAIATAVLEALHGQNRCRGLFATHFHELATLAERLPRLALRTMRVREWRGAVVFQHEVADGVAERSWGVHVARLAGVPAPVVARARTVLGGLERQRAAAREKLPLFRDLPDLVDAVADAGPEPSPDVAARDGAGEEVRDALLALDLDAITPREAHETLYRLRALIGAAREEAHM